MEFYTKHAFLPDEDTTDTEDDSGIAEVSEMSSSVDYTNDDHEVALDPETFPPIGDQQPPQNQDALGRFFSYW